MGSNTHQMTQITVTPSVMDASPENPAADMRYAAATATMGPAGKASCFADSLLAEDIERPWHGNKTARLPMLLSECNRSQVSARLNL